MFIKKDMSYNQNYSKENFSQLQVRVDIFILYLTIIDSYGAHSIETYLNGPENYKPKGLKAREIIRIWTKRK